MIRLLFMICLALNLTGTLACAAWAIRGLTGPPPPTWESAPRDDEGFAPSAPEPWEKTAILRLITLFSLSLTSGAGLLLARLGLP